MAAVELCMQPVVAFGPKSASLAMELINGPARGSTKAEAQSLH
jgi:hypothetical protein